MKVGDAIRLLRWPLTGLAIACVGGLLNALGWYLFESRPLAITGFVICALGIAFGIVAIIVGQIVLVRDGVRSRRKE